MTPEYYEFDLFGHKVCAKCETVLPANGDYFGRDKSRNDGCERWCRECRSLAHKAEYERIKADPERYADKLRKFRDANRKRHAAVKA